jgi:hypothetical protein
MYNYVLAWMVCYLPYLINAFLNNDNWMDSSTQTWMYAGRNATLYSSGVLCLVVYGLANAFLKRSLRMACDRVCLTDLCCLEGVQASYLRAGTDKAVAFACVGITLEQRLSNKDYVTTRLSKPEKYLLYKVRRVSTALFRGGALVVCKGRRLS